MTPLQILWPSVYFYYPELQDWVGEEVREITVNDRSENWDYTEIFSDLKRCRAVLVCTDHLDALNEIQEN